MNKEFLKELFPEEFARIELGNCPFCKKHIDPDSFRNEISKREFKISGLCQDCQDKMFGKD